MITLRFKRDNANAFSKELSEEIKRYFTNGKSRYGNAGLVIKSLIMILLYIVPIVILCFGIVQSSLGIFVLYLISGFGMAGVGMNVMHDALHGSFSGNRRFNQIMGYSINLIGASISVWKIQHNVLHHTFTNIDGADEDIEGHKLLRFSPGQKYRWIHKFQFIYAWFFYALMSLIWVTIRDFKRVLRYREMGFFKEKGEFQTELIRSIALKIAYFSVALFIPMIVFPQGWFVILLSFLCMHFLAGTIISLVFQTAHVMPSSEFPVANDEGSLQHDRIVHQLLTTSNFAPRSRIFSWLIGGLNYQIEHHLMPNVSHIHYRGLSKVVRELAQKHGLPYNCHKTFAGAVFMHHKMLYRLGMKKSMVYSA